MSGPIHIETLLLAGFIGALFGCLSSAGVGAQSSSHAGDPGGGSPLDGDRSVTVSTWLGTNVSGDLPYVEITNQLAPFDTPSNQKDARGYPVAGVSGTSSTDIGFVLPSGMYKISYRGTGSVQVSGIGNLAGAWHNVNGEQRNEVNIIGTPGEFGQLLVITIHNNSGQFVQDIHVLHPTFDYEATQIFMPGFLNLLRPFRSLRFMGWMRTSTVDELKEWSEAPQLAGFGRSRFGDSYANIAALANETGKDIWVNIPPNATDDFVHHFANFMVDGFPAHSTGARSAGLIYAVPTHVRIRE